MHIRKINLRLRAAIEDAKGHETLRAVMVLASSAPGSSPEDDDPPTPAAFGSREAYRWALIDHRRREIQGHVGPTLERLQSLSLKPMGGSLGHTVVVEGSARHLLQSLDLPGVVRASLDRSTDLIGPVPDDF